MKHFIDRKVIAGYCKRFNQTDDELYRGDIPNCDAADFLTEEIPCFDCPDPVFQEIWYFRWWSLRKHILSTPFGRVILEFLPDVNWSGPFNTINCPAAHQLREARWFNSKSIAEEYLSFWFEPQANADVRKYSFGAASSALDVVAVSGNHALLKKLYPSLAENYTEWKKSNLCENGLFYQTDNYDGMECSIGGSGYRVTINSCMSAEALALAQMAERLGLTHEAELYRREGEKQRSLWEKRLWNEDKQFFTTRRKDEVESQVEVRELHGYTPWYYYRDLPEKYDIAWTQLMDTDGFFAPYGPTTAERRHPDFALDLSGHECQWNGPSWPFSTAVTLTGLANLLQNRNSTAINKRDYFEILSMYTRSHYIFKDGGRIPWIDENINPFTGEWLARKILLNWQAEGRKSSAIIPERGKDYSHSAYADLIISGLCGIDASSTGNISVRPLLPQECWDYFMLDGVKAQNHTVTLLYDSDGSRYNRGRGLHLFVDGEKAASGELGTGTLKATLS